MKIGAQSAQQPATEIIFKANAFLPFFKRLFIGSFNTELNEREFWNGPLSWRAGSRFNRFFVYGDNNSRNVN